jgi:hypothetical protein
MLHHGAAVQVARNVQVREHAVRGVGGAFVHVQDPGYEALSVQGDLLHLRPHLQHSLGVANVGLQNARIEVSRVA